MWSKDFDGWNDYQKIIQGAHHEVYFQERDMWWCSVGVNIGHEQDGHHEQYVRSVLILRGFSQQSFWGVPISTKLKPANPYYLAFEIPSGQYSALISQMRFLDAKRLIRRLYTMPQIVFSEIQLAIIRVVVKPRKINGLSVEGPRIPKE